MTRGPNCPGGLKEDLLIGAGAMWHLCSNLALATIGTSLRLRREAVTAAALQYAFLTRRL